MTTILIKKKDTAGAPAPGDLTNSSGGTEIAVNTATKRIYTKDAGGNVVELGTNPSVITNNLLFSPDNTYDIGASGASRPRTIYVGTSVISPAITDSGLTSGRLIFASTGGLLADSANFTYSGTNAVLSAGRLIVKTLVGDSNGLNLYRSTSDSAYLTEYFDGTLYLGVNNTYQLYMTKSRVYTNVDAELNGVRAGNGPGNYSSNTLFGRAAFSGSVTGGYNTVVGYNSANAITSGNENVAIGSSVLNATVDGVRNTAVGNNALINNVSGGYNVALGMLAASTIVGSQNVVVGYDALAPASNTNISGVVAIGYQANKLNGGYGNQVSVGHQALYSGGGGQEVAVGYRALYSEGNVGGVNTAVGYEAMNAVTAGARNTAMGYRALYGSGSTPSPADNVAIGHSALLNAQTGAAYNVAVGGTAGGGVTSGQASVYIGHQAGQSNQGGSNAVFIGHQAGNSTTVGSQTAVGYRALYQTTVAAGNTAIGYESAYASVRNASDTRLTAVGQQALYGSTQGYESTAVGFRSMFTDLSGRNNTAVGFQAMYGGGAGSGYYNVAIGGDAMSGLTNGVQNVAVGKNALLATNTGSQNVAVGSFALTANTSGTLNVAMGDYAGSAAQTASYNVFVGGVAGYNTTGGKNTYVGYGAGYLATTGTDNVAVGYLAYDNQTATGSENTAVGSNALYNSTSGNSNVAVGFTAGKFLTTAIQTTIVGWKAMASTAVTGNYNTALGAYTGNAMVGGERNLFVGAYAGYSCTGSRNTFVGGLQGSYGCGELMTSGSSNTILGAFSGLESGVLDIRTSSNNIVLSDGDGRAQFYVRYGNDSNTASYRLRSAYHGLGYIFSSGTVNSGSSVAVNVNGTGNDGSIGAMGVMTRWTSVDGGDSTAYYIIAHGHTYNTYTLQQKSEVNSITINESSGTITISNGSANQISYQFVYTVFSTGELIRLNY